MPRRKPYVWKHRRTTNSLHNFALPLAQHQGGASSALLAPSFAIAKEVYRMRGQIKIVPINYFLTFWTFILLTNTLVWSSEGVWEIVLKSTYQECLFSGKVSLLILREYKPLPLSEQFLRKNIKDPKRIQIELEINKQLKLNPKEKETLFFIFDNINYRFLKEAKKNDLSLKEIFTKKMRSSITYDPHSQYAHKYSVFRDFPRWTLGWEFHLLRGRFWECMAKSSNFELGKLTESYAIVLSRQINNPKVYSEIKLDLRRGYKPVSIKTINERGQIVLEAQISYRQYQQDFWYPAKLVVKVYGYPLGRKVLSYQETYEIEKAEFNVPLTDKDFELGDIPVGAFVQDNRFNPPLVYIQGHRQFTDEELFQMARNRELLNDPKWMGYEMPTGKATWVGYLIAGIGLVLTVISLYMARRFYRMQRT